MLARDVRLSRRTEFSLAVRGGARSRRGPLVLHVVLTERSDPARVGFIVGKAVGNAVVRHRVTRRLRHIAADHLGHIPRGALVAVRAMPGADDVPFVDLALDFSESLRRAVARLNRVAA